MKFLIWLVVFVLLPLLIVGGIYRRLLRKYPKTFFWSAIVGLIFGLPWNYLAVKNNVWFAPAGSTIGTAIAGSSPEVWLFTILTSWWVAALTLILKNKGRAR